MNSRSSTVTSIGMGLMMMRGPSSASPFTVSQWQELEHQALIYKYLMAGVPIPPDLVLPFQKSFESMTSRLFHHPAMGYVSYYGKKVDPEPGRCRRTDGKKWRCSKEAYPDSKYCERHMHRGRNRSRKPVESPLLSTYNTVSNHLSTSSSCSAASSIAAMSGGGLGRRGSTDTVGGAIRYKSLPLHGFPAGDHQDQSQAFSLTGGGGGGSNQSRTQFQLDHVPYAIPTKDYRYLYGLKAEEGERSFFSEASGGTRDLAMDTGTSWPLTTANVSFSQSKSSENGILQSDYPYISTNEFPSERHPEEESQPLRPFLDEWPKSRDAWSGLEEERSNQTGYSTTRLSISIPMGASELSSSSPSPHT